MGTGLLMKCTVGASLGEGRSKSGWWPSSAWLLLAVDRAGGQSTREQSVHSGRLRVRSTRINQSVAQPVGLGFFHPAGSDSTDDSLARSVWCSSARFADRHCSLRSQPGHQRQVTLLRKVE